jgi:hypothetical protein
MQSENMLLAGNVRMTSQPGAQQRSAGTYARRLRVL